MQLALAALSGVEITRTVLPDETILYEARDERGCAIKSQVRADCDDPTLVYTYFGAYFDAFNARHRRPSLRLVG